MFGKKLKEDSQYPNGWTDEMLNEFLTMGRSFEDGTTQRILLIKQIRKSIIFRKRENIFLNEEIKILANIGCLNNSQLQYVIAEITFPNADSGIYDQDGPGTAAIGYWWLNEQDEEYPELLKTPKLMVSLFGGVEVVQKIESLFINNKVFGNSYLPLWIRLSTGPIREMTAKQALSKHLEITQWSMQQGLDLRMPIQQDFFM